MLCYMPVVLPVQSARLSRTHTKTTIIAGRDIFESGIRKIKSYKSMLFTIILSYAWLNTLLVHTIPANALPRPIISSSSETTELVKRAATSERCSLLDVDDTQSLPGWPKLEKYARDTWGGGEWSIDINPSGYKDKPATMCVAQPPVKVNISGKPNCTENRVAIPPIENTNTIPVNEGFTSKGNWNITTSLTSATDVTTAAHAEFFHAMFQMPDIPKLALGSVTTFGAFINAPHNSFVTSATNVTIRNVDLTPVPDEHCIGTILDQQCIIPAEGKVRLVASGYIWFQYKTKRAPLANPKGGKHSRYAVKLEDVLKNETERSTWIDFKGYMNTSMRYDYFDECRYMTF